MSHAKRVTKDIDRKNPEYHVTAAAIRKVRTDKNCLAEKSCIYFGHDFAAEQFLSVRSFFIAART